jgi:ABC-type dipeptide/oligopeptide/nickel transport system permease component
MLAFILRRLIQAVIVMVVVALIAFMLFQYVGDPVVFLLGQDASPAQITQLRADLGLDRPFVVQFWHFLDERRAGRIRPEPAPGRQGLAPDRRTLSRDAGAGGWWPP